MKSSLEAHARTPTHVRDDETAAGGLVLGLPRHDGAVHVVRVGSRREDEEERRQADEDVEQGRDRALHSLFFVWFLFAGVQTYRRRARRGEGRDEGAPHTNREETFR